MGSVRWETKLIIGFDVRRTEVTGVTFKETQKMNWKSYKHGLRVEAVPCKNCSGQEVEMAVDLLQ